MDLYRLHRGLLERGRGDAKELVDYYRDCIRAYLDFLLCTAVDSLSLFLFLTITANVIEIGRLFRARQK